MQHFKLGPCRSYLNENSKLFWHRYKTFGKLHDEVFCFYSFSFFEEELWDELWAPGQGPRSAHREDATRQAGFLISLHVQVWSPLKTPRVYMEAVQCLNANVGRSWQAESQKDDTISLGVCKNFSITTPVPQLEDVSCFSPYASLEVYFLLCQSFPQKPCPSERLNPSLNSACKRHSKLDCLPQSCCPLGLLGGTSKPICQSNHTQ